GQARQMFANLNPGHIGGGRSELAADALGSVGLRVERFMLRGPAGHVEQNASLRRAGPRRRCLSGRAKSQGVCQTEPLRREQTRAKKNSTVHGVLIFSWLWRIPTSGGTDPLRTSIALGAAVVGAITVTALLMPSRLGLLWPARQASTSNNY